MKLLIDVADSKADSFIRMLKDQSFVKTTRISTPDAELFAEIKEIRKAMKSAEDIKAGKLKGRPADELLNEL